MRNTFTRSPWWLMPLFFLGFSRALLNIPALIGANIIPPDIGIASGSLCPAPRSLPCLWASWDGDYYLRIALNGYSYHGAELAFFPLYPLLTRLIAFGNSALLTWSGLLISNSAFVLAALILWRQVSKDFNESIAWGTLISYVVFPTSLFFSAIYSEGLFLLFSVLVYWFSARRSYVFAGVFVSLASLTRATGLLLAVIPIVEIFFDKGTPRLLRTTIVSLCSIIGVALYGIYLWIAQGSPMAFAQPQGEYWKRSLALPWQTLWDGFSVFVSGSGSGRSDFLVTLAFLGLAVLAFFFLRKSLIAYFIVAIIALLVFHGPPNDPLYSMDRFVLGIFPGFIALATLLERARQLKWAVWATLATRLIFSISSFTSERWVA